MHEYWYKVGPLQRNPPLLAELAGSQHQVDADTQQDGDKAGPAEEEHSKFRGVFADVIPCVRLGHPSQAREQHQMP